MKISDLNPRELEYMPDDKLAEAYQRLHKLLDIARDKNL